MHARGGVAHYKLIINVLCIILAARCSSRGGSTCLLLCRRLFAGAQFLSCACPSFATATMIIPVRCFTCGKVIGNKWEMWLYLRKTEGVDSERCVCSRCGVVAASCDATVGPSPAHPHPAGTHTTHTRVAHTRARMHAPTQRTGLRWTD
jgi:DNA-directed RNA polymerase subunit N (RpoN/RPB10)